MSNKDDIWLLSILMVGIIIIVIICSITLILNNKNDFEINIDCNSGKIGVDYQSYYNTSIQKSNLTLLDETYEINKIVGWTPKIFNIKGIDNLNCKATIKTSSSTLGGIIILKMLEV